MTVIPIYVYRCPVCDDVKAETKPAPWECLGSDHPHEQAPMECVIESHIEVTADA